MSVVVAYYVTNAFSSKKSIKNRKQGTDVQDVYAYVWVNCNILAIWVERNFPIFWQVLRPGQQSDCCDSDEQINNDNVLHRKFNKVYFIEMEQHYDSY